MVFTADADSGPVEGDDDGTLVFRAYSSWWIFEQIVDESLL